MIKSVTLATERTRCYYCCSPWWWGEMWIFFLLSPERNIFLYSTHRLRNRSIPQPNTHYFLKWPDQLGRNDNTPGWLSAWVTTSLIDRWSGKGIPTISHKQTVVHPLTHDSCHTASYSSMDPIKTRRRVTGCSCVVLLTIHDHPYAVCVFLASIAQQIHQFGLLFTKFHTFPRQISKPKISQFTRYTFR